MDHPLYGELIHADHPTFTGNGHAPILGGMNAMNSTGGGDEDSPFDAERRAAMRKPKTAAPAPAPTAPSASAPVPVSPGGPVDTRPLQPSNRFSGVKPDEDSPFDAARGAASKQEYANKQKMSRP